MWVDYKLTNGQVRPAVVVRELETGSADLTVFLRKGDYGQGIHENEVRRGFGQLENVKRGTEPGQWVSPGEVADAVEATDETEPKAGGKKKSKGSGR